MLADIACSGCGIDKRTGNAESALPHKIITIRSFIHAEPHREIVCFGLDDVLTETTNFTIYEAIGIYSDEYKKLLQPYFLNF